MKVKKIYANTLDPIEYFLDKKVLFISAHPDDEIIGAGTLLTLLKEPSFLHTTDGAPKDKIDCIHAGYFDLKEYSNARRSEFRSALFFGDIQPNSCYYLEISDQESIYRLNDLIYGTAAVISEVKPDIIFTHPYEGGHPDHDTVSFAVHFILKDFQSSNMDVPLLYEFTSYFSMNGNLTTGEFIPGTYDTSTIYLGEQQREIKRKMLDQFISQKNVLINFPLIKETFRRAPDYNFYLPPHIGKLYYEYFNWGVTPEKWREIVRNFIEDSDYCGEEF